ncbi:MAG TPA: sensor histidine kinase [Actinomycetota bacterium]|nr:sensor histidine kinase [Actinomycetota bacterium]
MSRGAARGLSLAILAVCAAAIVASMPLNAANRAARTPDVVVVGGDFDTARTREVLEEVRADLAVRGDPESGGSWITGILVAIALGWIIVGSLIVSRQPGNWAGWIFVAVGAPLPLLSFLLPLVVYGVKTKPGAVPLIGAWAVLGEYVQYPIALVPLLFVLYPNGHPPSPRWRWAVRGLIGGATIAFVGFLLRPGPMNTWLQNGILYQNPFGIDAFARSGGGVIALGTMIALTSALSTAFAVRQRFRASVGGERQRVRWLVSVALLGGTFLALQWMLGLGAAFFLRDADLPVFDVLLGLTAFTLAAGIPAAYLVAIFRHGLWELDVVIRKAVVAAVVVAGLTMLGLLAFAVVPLALVGRGGADVSFLPLSVGLALGLLTGPLRRRARRIADRLVYGKRATPYEVLAEFSGRMAGTYPTEDVLPRMAQILAAGTGAEAATVWLRVGDELRPGAGTGAHTSAPLGLTGAQLPSFQGGEHAVAVRHRGELLGALSVRMPASDPMNPAKEKLVHDLAGQAGLVLRNVRLIEELRESRRRLVAAQDEERRRIERNLHDGAQQQLVALAVHARLAEQLVDRDATRAKEAIAKLQGDAADALENLRDLARGIYPPLLADRGLAAAIQAQAHRSPIPVAVQADGVSRYPEEVEAAVYFSVLEALQNVAKYAGDARAEVRLSASDEVLRFEVVDDGAGFDPASAPRGSGLQGMADRLEALGGSLEIRTAPGRGTTVAGRVPVRSAPATT